MGLWSGLLLMLFIIIVIITLAIAIPISVAKRKAREKITTAGVKANEKVTEYEEGLIRDAQRGDVAAQVGLAEFYYHKNSHEQADYWYRMAADQGDEYSIRYLSTRERAIE